MHTTTPTKRRLLRFIPYITAILCLGALWLARKSILTPQTTSSQPDKQVEVQASFPLPDHGAISDFSLTERSGVSVSKTSLLGSIWLVDFIFTRCGGPCPLMSGHMKTLQAHFAQQPMVRLLSITTDPINDTPAALQVYAERFHASPEKWWFLTGDQQQIIHLSQNAFKLPAGDMPDMHSTRFVLLDQQAHIRGWFDSTDADFQERLRAAVEALLASK